MKYISFYVMVLVACVSLLFSCEVLERGQDKAKEASYSAKTKKAKPDLLKPTLKPKGKKPAYDGHGDLLNPKGKGTDFSAFFSNEVTRDRNRDRHPVRPLRETNQLMSRMRTFLKDKGVPARNRGNFFNAMYNAETRLLNGDTTLPDVLKYFGDAVNSAGFNEEDKHYFSEAFNDYYAEFKSGGADFSAFADDAQDVLEAAQVFTRLLVEALPQGEAATSERAGRLVGLAHDYVYRDKAFFHLDNELKKEGVSDEDSRTLFTYAKEWRRAYHEYVKPEEPEDERWFWCQYIDWGIGCLRAGQQADAEYSTQPPWRQPFYVLEAMGMLLKSAHLSFDEMWSFRNFLFDEDDNLARGEARLDDVISSFENAVVARGFTESQAYEMRMLLNDFYFQYRDDASAVPEWRDKVDQLFYDARVRSSDRAAFHKLFEGAQYADGSGFSRWANTSFVNEKLNEFKTKYSDYKDLFTEVQRVLPEPYNADKTTEDDEALYPEVSVTRTTLLSTADELAKEAGLSKYQYRFTNWVHAAVFAHYRTDQDYTAVVRALVEAGEEVDAHNRGVTALFEAVHWHNNSGHDMLSMVLALLKSGADLHAETDRGTPFEVAKELERRYPERQHNYVVALFEFFDEGFGGRKEGETLLHYAVRKEWNNEKDYSFVVYALATGGEDVEATTHKGVTPLFEAVAWHNYKGFSTVETVQALLDAGANKNFKTSRGTPLELAEHMERIRPHRKYGVVVSALRDE